MRHPFLWPVYALCGALVFIVIVGSAREARGPSQPVAPLAAVVQPTPAQAAVGAPTATPAPPPPTEPPSPTAAPTQPPAAEKPAAPTATPRFARAGAQAAEAKPTAPPPPTATARPAASIIDFTGAFKPNMLRVGEKLVIELGIDNKSDRAIEGVRIGTSGPWGKFTVVNVLPAGDFDSGLLQYSITSRLTIPPGQRRLVSVVAYPNEPGSHEFTFIPHEGTRQLVGDDGKGIVIGGKVSVIR